MVIQDRNFPTKEQELILKASILKGKTALDAWEEWVKSADLEGYLDQGSFRLLPLLYKNLENHDIKHQLMERLKGTYRMTWYKNQTLFFDISKIVKELENRSINTLLLKGTPLILNFYKNFGVRPMYDIDLLIPIDKVHECANYLNQKGWELSSYKLPKNLRFKHSVSFKGPNKKEMDIHWHPFLRSSWENSHDDFWANAMPININNVETLSPSTTDLFLLTIIHGTTWHPEPMIHWIPDAAIILNSSDYKIDWDRFVDLVIKYKVNLRTSIAMNYLHEKFNLDIPKKVLKNLNSIKVKKLEKIEYHFTSIDTNKSFLGMFPVVFFNYLNISNGMSLKDKIVNFTSYLNFVYKTKNSFHFITNNFFIALKRAFKKN